MAGTVLDQMYGPNLGNYLDTRNPFSRTVDVGGQSVNIAPSFSDAGRATAWTNQAIYRNTVAPLAQLAPLAPGQQTNTPGNTPGVNTLTAVKNPAIQQSLNSLLAAINGLSTNPNVNQNVVQTNTKSPQLQSAVNTAYGTQAAQTDRKSVV